MCTQIFLRFHRCPCQLRYHLDECEHGRSSARCVHVATALKWTHRDYCHFHMKTRRAALRRERTKERDYQEARAAFFRDEYHLYCSDSGVEWGGDVGDVAGVGVGGGDVAGAGVGAAAEELSFIWKDLQELEGGTGANIFADDNLIIFNQSTDQSTTQPQQQQLPEHPNPNPNRSHPTQDQEQDWTYNPSTVFEEFDNTITAANFPPHASASALLSHFSHLDEQHSYPPPDKQYRSGSSSPVQMPSSRLRPSQLRDLTQALTFDTAPSDLQYRQWKEPSSSSPLPSRLDFRSHVQGTEQPVTVTKNGIENEKKRESKEKMMERERSAYYQHQKQLWKARPLMTAAAADLGIFD
ncbi:Uu.00g026480.m01.CDS01 [Anthostomella pinea]|uniref:Uu.00g026480.m01.CDS01 n=1 Tax=Anthostomella pinea TaxID=933095 RepID=A0AAI8V8J5_9PEZI|nr:Uu.00g026480.m01.CDS01 [Anthostomella pinea]